MGAEGRGGEGRRGGEFRGKGCEHTNANECSLGPRFSSHCISITDLEQKLGFKATTMIDL